MAPARACFLLRWAIQKKEAAARRRAGCEGESEGERIFSANQINRRAVPSATLLPTAGSNFCRLGRMPTVALLFANTSLILIHWPTALDPRSTARREHVFIETAGRSRRGALRSHTHQVHQAYLRSRTKTTTVAS
jgi:hypothetical protein